MERPGKVIVVVVLVFALAIGVAVVYGALRDDTSSPPGSESASGAEMGDHWHAALGVNVCGEWLPDAPEFHARANQAGVQAGLHSHGDGLVHLHPFASDEAGDNATVGRFMEFGGWEVADDSFTAWDGAEHRAGQPCTADADAPARVQWKVAQWDETWPTEPETRDLSSYVPKNGDVVAIYYLPEGSGLPKPPNADAQLSSIADLGGAPAES